MKWIGQHIYDLISRFRGDVYLENISSGTIASGGNLGLDSNNKIVKQDDAGITDLHGAGVDGSNNQLLTDDGDGTVTSEAYLTFVNTGNVSTLSLLSDQDTGDLLSIATTTHGATTITTTDDDSHAADLTFVVDGFTKFDSADNDGGGVEIETGNNAGVPALTIDGNDADQAVLSIEGGANTTKEVISISSGKLNTGHGLLWDNNKTGTGAANYSILHVDHDKTGVTANVTTVDVTGLELNMLDSATNNVGAVTYQTGLDIDVVSSSTAGTKLDTGIKVTTTDGNHPEMMGTVLNPSFVSYSAADAADNFSISTFANGETRLATVDGGANAANLYVESDGLMQFSSITQGLFRFGVSYLSWQTTFDTANGTYDFTSSTSSKPLVQIKNTNSDTNGSILRFTKDKGAAGADDDILGDIEFYGDDAGQNQTRFGLIRGSISTAADGSEGGQISLSVATHDGEMRSGLIITDGDAEDEIDVTIGREATSLTTIAGSLTVTSDLTVSGTTTTLNTATLNVEDKNIVLNYAAGDTSSTADGAGITIQDAVDASNDASLTWTAADDTFEFSHAVEINNGSSGGTAALTIDNDDVDQIALDIDAANTTGNIIDIDAQALTGGNAIFIDSNSLTGSLIHLDVDDAYTQAPILSHSSNPTKLINIDYDKSGVTDNSGVNRYVNALDISMVDAATNHVNSVNDFIGVNIEIDAASNQGGIRQKGVKVTLTDADTGIGSGGAQSAAFWSSTEDGGTDFFAQSSADGGDYFAIQTTTHGATTIKTQDDDATAAHLTFDIDGDIKNDAASGNYYWYQNGNTDDYLRLVVGTDGDVKFGTVDAAAAAASFEIEADGDIILDPKNATTGVQIDGTANTTANALNIDCDALTTGNAIFVDVDSALTTDNTVDIMKIDFDKSGNVASGNTVNVYGLEIDLNDNATSNVGNTYMTGIHIGIDHANANGIAYQTGVAVSLTDGDVAQTTGFSSYCEDGGVDFKAFSSADTGDYFTIATTAHGATTLTTVDDDAAAAHFEIAADGNITLDPAGTIALEADTTVSGDLTVNGGNATINGGDTTDAILKLATNTASASDDVIIELVTDEDGTPRQARIGVDHSDNTLKLVHGSSFSGGTNGICVDSSGNVGLGTASPEAHLHLESAGDTAIIVRADVGNSGEDDNPLIHLQQDFVASGSSGVLVDSKIGIVGNTGQIFTNSLGNSAYMTAQGSGATTAIQFATGGLNGQDTDTTAVLPTARMTIAGDGNIGVGVNDPDSMLEIYGTSTQLKLSNNASDYATLATGTHGNLTIATVDAAAAAAHFEVEADGNITLDANGDINLYPSGGDVLIREADEFLVGASNKPQLTLQSVKDDNTAAYITFDKNPFLGAEEATPANGDHLGTIQWTGVNNAMQLITYAYIQSTIAEVTDTDEAAGLYAYVATSNGTTSSLRNFINGTGHATNNTVNVEIGDGAASTTTIAGDLMVTTDIELGHASDTTIARSAAGTVTIEGNQVVTAGVATGNIVHVPMPTYISLYVLYMNTQNYWYSPPMYSSHAGSNAAIGSYANINYQYQARLANYVAPRACKLKKVSFVFSQTSSYLSGDIDLEFGVIKWTPDDDTANAVSVTAMTITDHDGAYTEAEVHSLVWDVTDNAASTLAANDCFAFVCRTTTAPGSGTTVRNICYGSGMFEIELT